jgi:anti-sigma28 factor (negative regulator of flagellin synthesis)
VRADLVEALMAEIEAGTYTVDCQAIAQKMLFKTNQ